MGVPVLPEVLPITFKLPISANFARVTAPAAIVIAPVSTIVASPDIVAFDHLLVSASKVKICASPGPLIVVSDNEAMSVTEAAHLTPVASLLSAVKT